MKHVNRGIGLAVLALLACGGSARAQVLFNVSLNTAPLVGNPNGPFYLDFQFTDGSGASDANNTATVSDFHYGGGSATGAPTASGGASGNIGSSVALTDSSFFNELYQPFNPGATLSFDVMLTTNVDAGGTPDEFSFAILDGGLNNVPTTGFGAFVVVDLDSASPTVQTFAASPPYDAMGSPVISAAGGSVPEPGPLAMIAGLLATMCLARRRVRSV